MKQLIECVPNISEGSDKNKINAIVNEVTKVEGVKLLDVDPGKATNRTVITFVGEPENVIKSAFLLIKKASELIDMSKHKGEHPRMGATDVCPLIPISNISMNETVKWAHKLGERIGKELNIPGYFYENAATKPERKNLANCRSGEYEGLKKKLSSKKWKPDFGPPSYSKIVKKNGATAISARDFLVAYNINLNTTSTRRANAIAFDIREAGRLKREGNKITGKTIKDSNGKPIRQPGLFKHVKGIGWFIKEYGIAQISYNLTNINISPLHKVFDKTCECATKRGLRVTGSELVGLVPKKVLVDAGKYFLKKQERSLGIPEKDIVDIAIKTLGLNELQPFNVNEKVIEYILEEKEERQLTDLTLTEFANETSSESPAPGGGSISAYVGTLGAALTTMVANLSAHKRGWDHKWNEFSKCAEESLTYQNKLLSLVNQDTIAFNKILEAYRLSKETKEEEKSRKKAIEEATLFAIETPFKVMEISLKLMNSIKKMAEIGNPNSITDAAVAGLCAKTAILGAFLNVKINCSDYNGKKSISAILKQGEKIAKKANMLEKEILEISENKI